MTDQNFARKIAEIMLINDEASKGLGISIETAGPGTSAITMKVSDKMLNGHKTCHGGCIFTLADSAFAFACNSYNKTAVAASANIHFVQPAYAGDLLTATASETYKAGRNGIYDITVTNQNDETIATFRGQSRVISKTGPLDAT